VIISRPLNFAGDIRKMNTPCFLNCLTTSAAACRTLSSLPCNNLIILARMAGVFACCPNADTASAAMRCTTLSLSCNDSAKARRIAGVAAAYSKDLTASAAAERTPASLSRSSLVRPRRIAVVAAVCPRALTAHAAAFRASGSVSRNSLDLLSVPLTIPLVCCHINHFRRAASCGEVMARRRKSEKWARLASRGMGSEGVVSPPVCSHRGGPARGMVPERCHASGAAVDICSDTPAWAQRAERAADGGVVYVSRALSVSPRAP
jgi:hypothetical protein